MTCAMGAGRKRLVVELRPKGKADEVAVHSIWRGVPGLLNVALFAAVILFASFPARATERLPLGAGDVVSIIYSGIGTIIPDVPVNEAGMLELQWLGTVQAEGRTVTEVQADVKAQADGRVFRHFNESGAMELLPVSSGDIWLRVVQRRGITVYGSVMASGEFPYRSNLTARAVIGLAGGLRTPLAVRDQALSPLQLFELQGRYHQAVHERATLSVRLWGLESRLSEDGPPPAPDAQRLGISDTILQRLVQDQEEFTRRFAEAGQNELSFMKRALAQAQARVEILRNQRAKQAEIVDAEEQEEARVQELVGRNLVPAQRLTETRRNTLLSSTRLLNIEEDLSEAELDVTRRAREMETLAEARKLLLLEEREKLRAELVNADATARRWGEGLDPSNSPADAQQQPEEPIIIIYRPGEAGVKKIETHLDAHVLPGDIVEVVFRAASLPELE